MTTDTDRLFRTLREAVATPDTTKHRAMTMRALIELAHIIAIGHNPFDRKDNSHEHRR